MQRLLLLSVALGLGLLACSDDGSSPDPEPENSLGFTVDAAAVERAKPLYQTYCAFCHGDQGQGYVSDNANALSHQDFLSTATDEFLLLGTVHGRPGTPMSAWGDVKGGPLSEDQARDIVQLLRSWQTVAMRDEVHDLEVNGSAQRGQAVYNVYCASCHGDEGEGVTAVSLNNPWFLATASDGFIRVAIEGGREGTPMPGYGEQLTQQNIDDLVALVRSWAVPPDTDPPEPFQSDLTKAVQNPDGEDPTFTLREGRYVPAAEVLEAMESGRRLVVLDARPVNDYLTSHIPGSVNVPFYDIERAIETIPKDVWVVAYCGCPHAVSGQAADALLEAGFPNVAVLDEGFYVWQDRGYPVEEGRPEP